MQKVQWYYAVPENSYLAGDYFQVLRDIITPAAPMLRQKISLIITLEWEYIINLQFKL